MAEKIKHTAATFFVISGFGCFYSLGGFLATVGLFVGIALAVLVMFFSEAGQRFIEYSKGSIAEVKKVVWPTRKETIQTTLIVFVFVVFVAIFLWLVDQGVVWIIHDLILQKDV